MQVLITAVVVILLSLRFYITGSQSPCLSLDDKCEVLSVLGKKAHVPSAVSAEVLFSIVI